MEAADAADSVLHGDLLECVLLRMPHHELTASPALVSREWRRASREVHRRHRRRRRHLLCLVAHVQGAATVGRSTHVYDPRDRAWAPDRWRVVGALPVRRCACAGGDRVYALSLASMAISEDAIGAAWRELPPPRVWRVDPVVAAVGPRVVVLGGGCGATAAAGVVEVLDEAAGWTTCPPMPVPLASRWVSSAASERRVYVVERRTGWASWFDPAARQWGPARRLQLPEGNTTSVESWAACGVSVTASGCGGARERLLVLARGGGGIVSLWGVDGDTLLLDSEDNASMPPEMSEKLSLGAAAGGVIAAAAAGAASGYVYNASEPCKGAVSYELVAAGVGGGHDSDSASSSKTGHHEKTWGKRSSSSSNSSRWEWEWLPCPPAAASAMSSSSSTAVVVFACSRSPSAPNK